MRARRTTGLRRRAAVLAAAALAAGTAACGGPGAAGAGRGSSPGEPSGETSGEVVVFAASSLTGSFGRIGRRFEAAHPDTTVTFSFGGSATLGAQISAGAPADVFAAADRRTMARVTSAGATAGAPVLFARNRLQIAVPPHNPGRVDGLDDFAREALTLAVCAPQVPCGAAAGRAFAAAGVTPRPDTLEQDVKAVLTKVRLGEVDAGVVYRTDVRAAGADVRGVDIPVAGRAVNDYQVAALDEATNPTAARAFVRFVRSSQGRRALADAGFDLP